MKKYYYYITLSLCPLLLSACGAVDKAKAGIRNVIMSLVVPAFLVVSAVAVARTYMTVQNRYNMAADYRGDVKAQQFATSKCKSTMVLSSLLCGVAVVISIVVHNKVLTVISILMLILVTVLSMLPALMHGNSAEYKKNLRMYQKEVYQKTGERSGAVGAVAGAFFFFYLGVVLIACGILLCVSLVGAWLGVIVAGSGIPVIVYGIKRGARIGQKAGKHFGNANKKRAALMTDVKADFTDKEGEQALSEAAIEGADLSADMIQDVGNATVNALTANLKGAPQLGELVSHAGIDTTNMSLKQIEKQAEQLASPALVNEYQEKGLSKKDALRAALNFAMNNVAPVIKQKVQDNRGSNVQVLPQNQSAVLPNVKRHTEQQVIDAEYVEVR